MTCICCGREISEGRQVCPVCEKGYEIIVKGVPPSNNEFMGNSHNFNKYRRIKESWQWLIKAAIKKKPKKPIEKATVYIRYYFKDARRRDPDNYSGKMILDPLVREGILIDDSFLNVNLQLSAGVDKVNPRTEIRIVEVNDKNKIDGLYEIVKPR